MTGDRLALLRTTKKITQEELAELIGNGVRAIQTWEQNIRKPPTDKLEWLADFYDVTTDYILGRTDIPNIYAARNDTPNVVPYPDTIAAHESEGGEEVDLDRMKEIIINAYNLIMKSELNKTKE